MPIAADLFPLMVVSIPILALLSVTLHRWMRFKERALEVRSDQTAEKAAQYAARNERLEQRVAVLERILTDRGGHLADEIEKLRDAPLN